MGNRISRTFQGNAYFLQNMLKDLEDKDMLLSTGQSNTIGWILGHITLSRGHALKFMNKECEIKDSEKSFDRGAEKNKTIAVSLEETLNELIKRGESISGALNEMNEDDLKRTVPITLPGGVNDLGGCLSFLAWHETFHLGQIDLIKAANGKNGIK